MSSNNTFTDGLFNVDQNSFNNKTTSLISNIPNLNLAVISNVSTTKNPDVQINLNSIYLSWPDFYSLFYNSPSGAFYINPSNNNTSAVSLASQSYETTYSKTVLFNLADQIRKAWSKKNNLPETSISPKNNIELERVSFLCKSLGSVYGEFIGLSYDEALTSLIGSGNISVADSDSSAVVKFIISLQYNFEPLDILILVNFTYTTSIPGYKNTNYFPNDVQLAYSRDMKKIDRTGIDLNDDLSVYSDFETKNSFNGNINDKVSNDLEEYSISSNKGSLISEISKIINGTESVTSSEW